MKIFYTVLIPIFILFGIPLTENHFFVSEQNVVINFDTLEYPNFKEINNKSWKITESYADKYNFSEENIYSTELWDAFTILPLLNEEWETKVNCKSYLKYLKDDKKYLLYSQNTFSLINDNGNEDLKYEINSENSRIDCIDYNKNKKKIYWAESQLDIDCVKDSWQIFEYDIKTQQKNKVFDNNNIKFSIIANNKTKTNCPYITDIKTSPNGENFIFKYTNIEYNNFCANLFIYKKQNEFIKIIDRCDENLNAVEFIDDNNILIITTNHNNKNIKLQVSDLTGTIVSSSGCYNKKGIKGEFIDFELSTDKKSFYLYYISGEKYYITHWDTNGDLIEKTETGGFYKVNYQEKINLTAFDYNILNLRNFDNEELLGVIFHEHDVFDFVITDNSVVSVDEGGGLKKWNLTKTNNHLLVLENTLKIAHIPVNINNFHIKIDNLEAISKNNYSLFAEQQIIIEQERLNLENDYQTFFKLNSFKHVGTLTKQAGDYHSYVKFNIYANMFYYPVQVFHISKYENDYKVTTYCGRCVNYFGYSKASKNYIIAIMPNNIIGYISNDELFEYNAEQKNSLVEIKLNTLPATETENILKKILE